MTKTAFKTIVPKDKDEWLALRKPLITSTEVAALFGVSPYCTPFELYHRKHDNLEVEFEPNARMVWGNRLESSIANGVAEDNGWNIRRMDEFIFDPDEKIGASFDYAIESDGILEVKNVDSLAFRDGWIIDGEDVQAPMQIEAQVQTQLYASGRKYAIIAALIGGNRVVLIKRVPDQVVLESIRKKISEFWASVAAHQEPAPDFAKDSEFIQRIYNFAEPGKVFNADERVSRLAFAYKQAADEAKVADEKKDAAKAELLTMIGTAEKVLGPTFTISCGLVGPAHVEYDRAGYRTFKISWRKQK